MTLRVVGAGLPRTGTNSLKLALERLLDGRCYHMLEIMHDPTHVPIWHAALRGEPTDWHSLLHGYNAAVDWPAATFWRELVEACPSALVLLSVREDSDTWWRSIDATTLEAMRRWWRDPTTGELAALRQAEPHAHAWLELMSDLVTQQFSDDWREKQIAIEAYERHNADVLSTVPRDRLILWRPGDGWAPLCERLQLAEPDEPFPKVNSTAEFQQRAGWTGL